jgi:hypothetical protein
LLPPSQGAFALDAFSSARYPYCMKIKTTELTGAALNWAVAKCEGMLWLYQDLSLPCPGTEYSTDLSQGGPIIKREGIQWISNGRADKAGKPYRWLATKNFSDPLGNFYGPTPLVAAMRCFVAGKLGNEVEIPEELIA